jgi:hypothetical protein
MFFAAAAHTLFSAAISSFSPQMLLKIAAIGIELLQFRKRFEPQRRQEKII